MPHTLPGMEIETQPESLGLDAGRLARVGDWMRREVGEGRLPGALTAVVRRDRLVYFDHCGLRDLEGAAPLTADTVFRIYSMTKPVTTVAALMLYEQGRFQLDDAVSDYLPELARPRVFVSGDETGYESVRADTPITIRQLMTHTAGFTYGFLEETPVDALYRANGVDFQRGDSPLAELVPLLAEQPLLFQPGTRWNYSVATDVLGRLVEVLSGETLEAFFNARILEPLGMTDTGFQVPEHALERFAANYSAGADGGLELLDPARGSRFTHRPLTFSGGGGLVSTAADYLRFARLLARGGELDGVRLLGRKTVAMMTANQLPGDLAAMGQPRFAETTYEGIGFGLGVSVMLDPARAQIMGSPGEYAWGGAASTAFWVDPAEELIVLFLTQLVPSSTYPLRRQLRVLTYQALID